VSGFSRTVPREIPTTTFTTVTKFRNDVVLVVSSWFRSSIANHKWKELYSRVPGHKGGAK